MQVRLEYPRPHPPVCRYYVFESFTESLEGDYGVCMRFTLLDGDFEDAEVEHAAEY